MSRKFSVASVTRDLQAVEDAMNVMLEALEEISVEDSYTVPSFLKCCNLARAALRKVKELGTHSLREGVEQ